MSYCRECQQPILFAVVSNKQGKPPSRMPLNHKPDPAGNVACYRDGTGTMVGRVLGKGQERVGYERVYMPHFATCAKRAGKASANMPADMPPGVTGLDEWKRARTEQAKGRRNRRGRPAGGQRYLGFTRRQP
jgi:hypothetical protein